MKRIVFYEPDGSEWETIYLDPTVDTAFGIGYDSVGDEVTIGMVKSMTQDFMDEQ